MTRRIVNRFPHALALTALFAVAAGCGGDTVKLVPAEGVISIDGKPAANIMVQFMPDTRDGNKGPTSTATTDEQGKFRLKSQDGRDGAVAGKHMVVLIDPEEERTPQGQAPKKKPRLDSKYAAPMTSNLTATVTEGGGPIAIDANGP